MEEIQLTALCEMKKGERGKVVKIEGDGRFISRITSVGLALDNEVVIINNDRHQPVLVYSRDTLIAVNQKEGAKLFLEEEQR